jgi:alkylhydroperoxidase family enzyme
MRLKKVETGHRLRERLMIGVISLVSRSRVPDVVRTLLYRPEIYGKAYNNYIHEIMRGRSKWPVGERELIATHVSSLNQCPF